MGNETNPAALPEDESVSFETAMERLETIVSRLESGDVPLEQAIELFQQGMKLSHLCSKKLEQVERKIEMLVEENGSFAKKPFAASVDEG
jgi:exodeoxyribonuclease VII small subunit